MRNLILAGGVALAALTTSAYADPMITGVTATASSQLSQYGFLAANTVNGAGLDSSGNRSTAANTMWLSNGNGAAGGTPDIMPSITFNLGGLYNVSQIGIYNYNENDSQGNVTGRGVSHFELFTSTDGINFTDGGAVSLAQAPGTNTDFVQTLSVQDQVQYVEFANLVAFPSDDNGFIGLSSVQLRRQRCSPRSHRGAHHSRRRGEG